MSSYRKLTRIGNSFYVSVPRDWVECESLGPGSLVLVEAIEGGLLLKPLRQEGASEARIIRIERGGVQEVVRAYLSGYEVIEVERPLEELRREGLGLEKLLSLLVGLEVVEDGERIVLQCFVKEGYDVRSVLARMDAISRSMYVDATAALETGDAFKLESVRERDNKLDRLYFLAVRLIRSAARSPLTSGEEKIFLVDARFAAKLLEEVGDETERMTYLQPSYGIADAAKVIAKYQEAVVAGFLEKVKARFTAPALPLGGAVNEGKQGAWLSLHKITKLVQDLAELI